MKRRDFLKLLAASLGAAGVSIATVTNVFGSPKASKMKVAEAIRRIVKRFETAKTAEERKKIAYDALCIISEAHRDYSLVWAGGAVMYYAHLNGDVNALIQVATANKGTPGIGDFLAGLKANLSPGSDSTNAVLFRYETHMACMEMGGHSTPVGDWTLRELEKHHPEVYARHLREHPA